MSEKSVQEETERLRDFIILECDNCAAFAPFDKNCASFIKRAHLLLGDIVPELKEMEMVLFLVVFINALTQTAHLAIIGF